MSPRKERRESETLYTPKAVIGDEALKQYLRGAGLDAQDNEEIGEEEKFKLYPASGRVAVKLKDFERTTKSGIVLISDASGPKPSVGTVAAVCKEYELEGEDYEPLYPIGSIVIFGKYTGTRLQVGREIFIVMRESDILAELVASDSPDAVSSTKVKVSDNSPD